MDTLLCQEDGKENDAFCQRGEDDRLITDGTCGARIASGRFSGLHTNDSHIDGRAKRGETDVQTSFQPNSRFRDCACIRWSDPWSCSR